MRPTLVQTIRVDMLVGKRHRLIKFLEPVQKRMQIALGLVEVAARQPTTMTTLDAKVAVENVQYELDKLGMRDAEKREVKNVV